MFAFGAHAEAEKAEEHVPVEHTNTGKPYIV